ncbi:hypothetical protein NLJ89_g5715 [Agrocybe chaxingu]|uniref:Transposase n=1 Tax=Agrocybe chaxingu TaxID=84603 RepID=A0A9W8MVC3_9AGAR|nr:hypothetical protein NLJ89_g5715 [Agrocybe chaxingu]
MTRKRKFNPITNLGNFVKGYKRQRKSKKGSDDPTSSAEYEGQENARPPLADLHVAVDSQAQGAVPWSESWTVEMVSMTEPSEHMETDLPTFSTAMEMLGDVSQEPTAQVSTIELFEEVPDPEVFTENQRQSPYAATCEDVEDEDEGALPGDSNQVEADKDPIDDSDDEAQPDEIPGSQQRRKGKWDAAPTIPQLEEALVDLEKLLRPPRCNKRQRYSDPPFDKKTIKRLEQMKLLCFNVLDMEREKKLGERGIWTRASVQTARSLGNMKKGSRKPGEKKAKDLRRWLRLFIDDREEVPTCNWSTSGRSLIDDEDFAQEIHAHLQSLGPYVSTEAIVRFLDTPEMLQRLHRKKTISLTTAQRWMKRMGYRWTINPKGQYVDGHERADVVHYRDEVFLPAILELEPRMRKYGTGDDNDALGPNTRRIVVWYHDESTFYAHDRRRRRWVHKGETAKPYAKGEGHSLMVANFVSAEYGWMRSPDGKEDVRILFKAGKTRDGYFDNNRIREHAARAMELLEKYYPDEDHVLVFDNATTHTKQPEGSLSALKMPKGPSENFFVEVNKTHPDGRPVYDTNGKIVKTKVRMGNGKFLEGREQAFYFADDHPDHPGKFKGMAEILEERGFLEAKKLKAQCGKKFSDCPPGNASCCCHRTLFNQPDFVTVESLLEIDGRERGFRVLFLPKFHCELNFIEQCWGYAKRNYRLLEPSSKEDVLERNVVSCLDGIPLITMRRREKTAKIMAKAKEKKGVLDEWDDVFSGTAYLDAVQAGRIQENDMVLLMSIDGAQLYQSKQSDCWIYIWIVLDLAPDLRYKKCYVLPGGFIPGPNKPKNVDSFLFPGFHHLSALMKEGLSIWDAVTETVFRSDLYLHLGAADGPGLTYLNGLTGHSGAYGCWLYCPVKGWRKEGGNHYYPALLKPHGFSVEGSDHPDIDRSHLRTGDPIEYQEALHVVLESRNSAQHQANRRKTGITKPSIFSGLPVGRSLHIPHCFGVDLMHLISLNIPDLLFGLWRGTLECDPQDSKHTWDWVVLTGNTWKSHGQRVADATPYLPGSFDHPPRNPAEKISSGYKAWEYLTYVFGLGPGLLHGILPDKYWKNYCKLVAGVRLIHQRTITNVQLLHSHQLLVEFEMEFEKLYYQRKSSRLHFVRQSIHALLHTGPEVPRLGPGACYTQWTMERTVGNLGEEIRQPSNPFQNLSERGVRRAQVNALYSMLPELEKQLGLPRVSEDIGDGFILLGAKERYPKTIPIIEVAAICTFYHAHNIQIAATWMPQVLKWARLQIPNQQIVRSAWKEKNKALEKVRMARNIMFHKETAAKMPSFGEIQYFFQLKMHGADHTVALVSIFDPPDPTLAEASSGALLRENRHSALLSDLCRTPDLRLRPSLFADPPTLTTACLGPMQKGTHLDRLELLLKNIAATLALDAAANVEEEERSIGTVLLEGPLRGHCGVDKSMLWT